MTILRFACAIASVCSSLSAAANYELRQIDGGGIAKAVAQVQSQVQDAVGSIPTSSSTLNNSAAMILGFPPSASPTPSGEAPRVQILAVNDKSARISSAKSASKSSAPNATQAAGQNSAGTHVAIPGVSAGQSNSGQRPFRQEFMKFAASGPAFDLYILALQQFQAQDQVQTLSYFQVSGIHGLPYVEWDGVRGLGNSQTGYCTHGSILFPSWHRPYMALFEQILWQNAQKIAASYPSSQQTKYKQAATDFRIPYWDWAFNATMPDFFNAPQITVNGPKGSQSINNPLYTYTFHPLPSSSQFPTGDALSTYKNTVRYPDSNGNSQPNLVNQQLEANAQALHDSTYQLLADQSNYAPFSNTGYTDSRGGHYNSIEAMHNLIHSLVGNGGHMGIIPYSAFDPIFWLHHTNVDRLFAIWQGLHPDSYTVPEANEEGTYTNAAGSTEDINTRLAPFHSNAAGTMYDSKTARSTKTFGYAYPEVVDWGVSASQLSTNVRTAVNKLYNPSGSLSGKRSLAARNGYDQGLSNSSNYQYFINFRVDK